MVKYETIVSNMKHTNTFNNESALTKPNNAVRNKIIIIIKAFNPSIIKLFS